MHVKSLFTYVVLTPVFGFSLLVFFYVNFYRPIKRSIKIAFLISLFKYLYAINLFLIPAVGCYPTKTATTTITPTLKKPPNMY